MWPLITTCPVCVPLSTCSTRKAVFPSVPELLTVTALPTKTRSAALKLSGADRSRQSQARHTPAPRSNARRTAVTVTTILKRLGSDITLELTRPRASANCELITLHAKHAIAARVQRIVGPLHLDLGRHFA